MRVRTKILLYIILPIFAVDLIVTLANFYTNYDSFKSTLEGKFISETEFMAAKISAENMRGVAVAKSTAQAASILFGKRPESVALIKDALEDFPNFIGASIGYELNADFADFRTELGLKNIRDGKDVTADGGLDSYDFAKNKTNVSMDEWIAKSGGGRFIAYWSRLKGELTLEPLTGMDTAMYSAGLRKKMEAGEKETFIVTEPYMYSNNVMMVEYSAPIFNEGKYCGQVAFDLDLSAISSLVNSMKKYKGGDIFLISSQGRIIVSTKNENLRTLSIDDLLTDEDGSFTLAMVRDENGQLVRNDTNLTKSELSKYRTTYRDILRTAFETAKNSMVLEDVGKRVSVFQDSTTRKSFCVSQSLIRPGNWVIVKIAPEDEFFAPVYASAFREFWGMWVYVFAMLFTLVFLRGTFARIKQALEISTSLASGNFRIDNLRIESSEDEAGRTLKSLVKAASKMRSFVLHIKFAGLEISNSKSEIDYMSGRCDEEINEINSAFTSISDSVKQLGENSQDLCDNADGISVCAVDGVQRANGSKGKIAEMETTLASFSRSASSVSRRLSIINERVENITSAVATILKVSEETNLLALNASIEAEKAGVYGVGFAVVAREIGRLAEQSASAVEDIETIVKDMKGAVVSGVSEMDKFSDEIRTGGADIVQLISDIEALVSNMQTIAPQIERLSTGIQSQRFGISKINDTVSDISDSMRQLTLVLREIASARTQLSVGSEKLAEEVSAFDVESKGGV